MKREEFAKAQINKYPQKNLILSDIPDWVQVGYNVHIAKGVNFSPRGFGYIKIDGKYKHIPHSGRVVIEDNVEIFEGVNIVRATADDGITYIRNGTKINSGCHIAHNVHIGENCLIMAGVIISGSAKIGNNCQIGIGAMIRNKIEIGDNVIIGMGSVVVKNIKKGSTVWGNPTK